MMEEEHPVEIMREGPGGVLERAQALKLSADEIIRNYEVVAQTENVIMAVDNPTLRRTKPTPDLRELGTTGQTIYGQIAREDYNSDLMGMQGLQIYDKMRKHGHVKAALRLVKTPILGARWYVDSPSEAEVDPMIVKFVHLNLFHWMTTSWIQTLTEILLMLDFGYYAFEKVYAKRGDQVIWKKWAPRHPMDIIEWDFDAHGGPTRALMYPMSGADAPGRWIGIDKLLLFTHEQEAGNITGQSILRPAYPHWFYQTNLYKIDAIQKERHGIGIPVIKLPVAFDDDDKRLADEIGRNLRTNEKAHIVLPPMWEILTLKLEGQQVDALASATHHGQAILLSMLGQFLMETGGNVDTSRDMFLKATRYIADIIRDVINQHAIPQLVFWNFGEQPEYPELKVRRIGDTIDWRTISFALRNLVGAQIIVPDDDLEKWARDEMDLPKATPETARHPATPQAPGGGNQLGMGAGGAGAGNAPRQSQAQNMKSAQTPGGSNIGGDQSGGTP